MLNGIEAAEGEGEGWRTRPMKMWRSVATRANSFLDNAAQPLTGDWSDREAHRVRAALCCLAISFVGYGGVAIHELARGHYWPSMFATAATLSAPVVGFAFWATRRALFLSRGVIAITYLLAASLTTATGGTGPGALFLLAVPPLAAAHLQGLREATLWAALSAATIGFTALLHSQDFAFPLDHSQDAAAHPRFAIATILMLSLFALAASWEALHNRMQQASDQSALRAREERQKALASAEHYRLLAEASSDLVLEIDPDGIIGFASSNSLAVLGAAPTRLIGRPARQFLNAEELSGLEETLRMLKRTGEADFEATLRRTDDGRPIRVQGRIRSIEGLDSRRQRLITLREAPLLENSSQRTTSGTELDTFARATRGISHDLQSYLTVVAGNAELASDAHITNSRRKEFLEEVVSATMNAGRLSRELLALGGVPLQRQSEIFINSLVQRFAPIAKRIAGDQIELDVQLDPRVSRVLVDPAHVERILLNLVANAREVMPGKGRIEIGTIRRVDPETRKSRCVLFVDDDGPGMTAEILERIFDTAFSTKSSTGPRGFGLSIVKDLARAARGEVSATSTPGQGARFEVVLPIIEENLVAASPPDAAPTTRRSVLVVHSEAVIRNLLRNSLEQEGFDVACVDSELAALDAIGRSQPYFDALLTEQYLPEFDALKLAGLAREKLSRIGVVIVSNDPELGLAPDDFVHIQKPYQRPELARAVRNAIVRSSRSPR